VWLWRLCGCGDCVATVWLCGWDSDCVAVWLIGCVAGTVWLGQCGWDCVALATPAHSVTMACISSSMAVGSCVDAVRSGQVSGAVATVWLWRLCGCVAGTVWLGQWLCGWDSDCVAGTVWLWRQYGCGDSVAVATVWLGLCGWDCVAGTVAVWLGQWLV
jgi:hypothetical protein